MASNLLAVTKRGTLESRVYQDRNKYHIEIWAVSRTDSKKIKDGATFYFDQDEAEMEASVLLDTVWREMSGKKEKLVPRM